MPRKNLTLDYVLSRISKDNPRGCWEWTGTLNDRGYGRVTVNNRGVRVHRFVFEQMRGPIPEGAFVCHRCDNRKCCNPDHLFLGDAAINMQDMASKGRTHTLPGESNPGAKLTVQQVREIRRRYRRGGSAELAEEFGVTKETITSIAGRRTWKAA